MNVMGTAAMGLMAAGARLFSSASNIITATNPVAPEGDRAFLPLQSVQAAAHQAGVAVGASSRRGALSNPVIRWPVPPWEVGGLAWSAGDLTGSVLNLTDATTAFKANLAIIRAADEMQKSLIDIRA